MLDSQQRPLYLRRSMAMSMLGVGKHTFRKLTSGPRPALVPLRLDATSRALFCRHQVEALRASLTQNGEG